jgi:hypothetical protein
MLGILHDCRFPNGMAASGQSSGFGGNLFIRDSLRVMRDVMPIRHLQPFERQMFSTLLQWQGHRDDLVTNESPDALPHQVFRQIIGGTILEDHIVERAEYWTDLWGVPLASNVEDGKYFVIYNCSDGPPLFIIALCEYMECYGRDILNDRYIHRATGEKRTVGDGARRCVEFILRHIKQNEFGLYGVPNTNPRQTSASGVMRDGFDAYVTSTGRLADYGSMVYLENQALANEALYAAARWFKPTSKEIMQWESIADALVYQTIEQLWMEDEQFFAAGRDEHGIVDMRSSVNFELLNSPFFIGLVDEADYVRAIARRLYSPEFMTPIGCRMTSLGHADIEGDYAPYQGTSSVWWITNGIAEQGLRRYSIVRPAQDIGMRRVVSYFNAAETINEKGFVDKHGRPVLQVTRVSDHADVSGRSVLCPAELSQPDMAWSASTALRILNTPYPPQAEKNTWQRALDDELVRTIRDFPSLAELGSFEQPLIDLERGKELKAERQKRFAQMS